jgi:hypothetical protein
MNTLELHKAADSNKGSGILIYGVPVKTKFGKVVWWSFD